jgi:hypothetical protein
VIWIYTYYARSDGLEVLQVIKLQRRAADIVDSNYKCERKFYSAEPLFLLDNNVRYPPELASGPFLLFIGRRTDVSKFGSEFDVNAKLAEWNPDIVIWGYFLGRETSEQDEVDRAIRDYAITHEFKIRQIGYIDRREVYAGFRASCRM